MSSYSTIKNVEKSFKNRLKELNDTNSEGATFTEKQYCSRILQLLDAFKLIVLESDYTVTLENPRTMMVPHNAGTLKLQELNDAWVLKYDDTADVAELDAIINYVSCLPIVKGKSVILLPNEYELVKAKLDYKAIK